MRGCQGNWVLEVDVNGDEMFRVEKGCAVVGPKGSALLIILEWLQINQKAEDSLISNRDFINKRPLSFQSAFNRNSCD